MGEGTPQPRHALGVRRATERLDSWKEIATYLKREIRTVQRWEKSLGLPVRRLADQQAVFAYKSEIDAWWRELETTIQKEEAEADLGTSRTGRAVYPGESDRPSAVEQLGKRSGFKSSILVLAPVAFGLLLTGVGLYILWPRIQQRLWGTAGRVTLAVLPFKNLSGDPDAQHVAEGLTEETLSRLGRLHPEILRVIELPPAAVTVGLDKLGTTSKTDYLLEGTVRRAGQKVAITAQLILVKDQTRIWGDNYERDLHDPQDIIPIEIEIADSLSSKVLNQLPQGGQPSAKVNRDAYETYLKGRFFWNKRTTENLTKAVTYFQQAIQYDPTYAPAFAGLADSYSLLGSAPYTVLPPKDAFPKAKAAAQKALELDSSLAEAHVSLGYAELVYDHDFAGAEKEFQEAIRFRPAYSTAHQYYAYYLTSMGRLDEAIRERQNARDLDPLSPLMITALGEAYYQARQYRLAIEQNQKSFELDSSYVVALVGIGRAYEEQGMYNQALDAFRIILGVAPDEPAILAFVGHVYAVSGHREEALNILAKLERARSHRYVPALYSAMVYTGLHDKEKAFEWLEKAYDERCEYLVYLSTEPMADPLRGDPRFSRLLERLGLKPTKSLTVLPVQQRFDLAKSRNGLFAVPSDLDEPGKVVAPELLSSALE